MALTGAAAAATVLEQNTPALCRVHCVQLFYPYARSRSFPPLPSFRTLSRCPLPFSPCTVVQHSTCVCAHALSALAPAPAGAGACTTPCPGDAASVCGSTADGLYSASGTAIANTTCSSEPAAIVLEQPAATPLPPADAAQTAVTFRVCCCPFFSALPCTC